MTSTFIGLEIAKRSLFAQQAAQQTTAHNIANANTQGYSRQTVNMVAARPMEALGLSTSTAPGQMGMGVEVDSVNRIREQFLDDQYRNENKSYGEWSTRQDSLQKLESIFNEPSDTGLRTTVENFWSAWQGLSKNPEDQSTRVTLKESALAMTDAFNYTAKKLDDLSSDLTNSLNVQAKQVDSTLQQITDLNNEIFRIEGLGDNANDLRDQRDLLVDQLSKVINVSVKDDTHGYVIKMGNTELVNGTSKSVTVDANFLESNYGKDLTSGQAYGLILSRDQYVKGYKDQLNEMIKTMATGDVQVTLPQGSMLPNGVTVTGVDGKSYSGTLAADTTIVVQGINGLHQLGYDLNGKQGEPFFQFTDGNEAETITVNPDIVNDVSKIAASNRVYTDANGNTQTVKGSNDLALAIAGLNDSTFTFASTGAEATVSDYYQAMIGKLGVDANEANRQADNQNTLVQQVDSSRQSVSGVSLDEEMSNMLKFQHAYNAAARLMTTFDQMLDKVINSMGTVGL